MKYLVDTITKRHQIYDEEIHGKCRLVSPWTVIEADSEGWIPWSGGVFQPLPSDCMVELSAWTVGRKTKYQVDDKRAGDLTWNEKWIAAYRPILTEQSEPKADETIFDDATVFDRLRTATEHAESIPAIIAEIQELLGQNWAIVPMKNSEAKPAEDMSDWRNWREGDLLECTSWEGGAFNEGHVYPYVSGSVISPTLGSFMLDRSLSKYFRFHSRPTGATK